MLYCHNLEMAHVDIRSFTSFSPEPSRLNISICVLTIRDYPWSKRTSASTSPDCIVIERGVAETDFVCDLDISAL